MLLSLLRLDGMRGSSHEVADPTKGRRTIAEHRTAALAMEKHWTQGYIDAVEALPKTMKQKRAVAAILSRYQRRRTCQVPVTATDVYAEIIARVCGDYVDLDPVERCLIHLKRQKVISGRRLVSLLARHQRELMRLE